MPVNGPGLVIAAAHPDDETIGCGGQLARWAGPAIVHLTDGAPRDMSDASSHGFHTREEYARARRGELMAALALAGVAPEQTRQLGFADKELSFHLAEAASRLAEEFSSRGCRIALTHPYEGGHPDHDATALAVHAACRLLSARGGEPPEIFEFTCYHARGGAIEVGEFLPGGTAETEPVALTEVERARKRRMLACFRTQAETLRPFASAEERLRRAPRYDFTRPPAPEIYYDWFDWGIRSAEWIEEARGALRSMGLGGEL